ncbi:hypothetical protein R3P38DRAFT_3296583 [Favolaschia claudopus]|uniref:Uncharacterized protein n=1 Tax=Favolaschia claudopus TaxID=2862362 RepID=A0AAV9Z8I7_9AGAR
MANSTSEIAPSKVPGENVPGPGGVNHTAGGYNQEAPGVMGSRSGAGATQEEVPSSMFENSGATFDVNVGTGSNNNLKDKRYAPQNTLVKDSDDPAEREKGKSKAEKVEESYV